MSETRCQWWWSKAQMHADWRLTTATVGDDSVPVWRHRMLNVVVPCDANGGEMGAWLTTPPPEQRRGVSA